MKINEIGDMQERSRKIYKNPFIVENYPGIDDFYNARRDFIMSVGPLYKKHWYGKIDNKEFERLVNEELKSKGAIFEDEISKAETWRSLHDPDYM